MQRLQKIMTNGLLVAGAAMMIFGAFALPSGTVSALSAAQQAKKGVDETNPGSTSASLTDMIKIIVNVLLFIVGVVSVIMIVIGGIKYTTSNGDSNQVTSAKNTILYSVIGLIVAILAYAIVDFVIGAFI